MIIRIGSLAFDWELRDKLFPFGYRETEQIETLLLRHGFSDPVLRIMILKSFSFKRVVRSVDLEVEESNAELGSSEIHLGD
jgi:hypothetical protein